MVQVKKDSVRAGIVAAAASLFEEKSYADCSVSEIAKRAHLAAASVYVYFPSKLDIAFAVFEPWLIARIAQTEIGSEKILNLRDRLEYVIRRFWRDIPRERNMYVRNFLQALAMSSGNGRTKSSLYLESRQRISRLILNCLPEERQKHFDATSAAHIVIMAFDGFVINGPLDADHLRNDAVIKLACDMIQGEGGPVRRERKPAVPARKPR